MNDYYKISERVIGKLAERQWSVDDYIHCLLSNEYFFKYPIVSDEQHLEMLDAVPYGKYKHVDMTPQDACNEWDPLWRAYCESDKFLPWYSRDQNTKIFKCSMLGRSEEIERYRKNILIPFFGVKDDHACFSKRGRFLPVRNNRFFDSQYVVFDKIIQSDLLVYALLTKCIVCFVGVSPPAFITKHNLYVRTMDSADALFDFLNSIHWCHYEEEKAVENRRIVSNWAETQLRGPHGANKNMLSMLYPSLSLLMGTFIDLHRQTLPSLSADVDTAFSCLHTVEKVRNESLDSKVFIHSVDHHLDAVFRMKPSPERAISNKESITRDTDNFYVYDLNSEPRHPWLTRAMPEEEKKRLRQSGVDLFLSDQYDFNENLLSPGFISSWFWKDKKYMVSSPPSQEEVFSKKHCETSFLFSLRGLLSPISAPLLAYEDRQYIMDHYSSIRSPTLFYIGSVNQNLSKKYPMFPLLTGSKECIYERSMFNIAIENSTLTNYFTEKIIDCFYTHTIPIYIGCSNIGEYFDRRGILFAETGVQAIEWCNQVSCEMYTDLFPSVQDNLRLVQYTLSEFGYPSMSPDYLHFLHNFYVSKL